MCTPFNAPMENLFFTKLSTSFFPKLTINFFIKFSTSFFTAFFLLRMYLFYLSEYLLICENLFLSVIISDYLFFPFSFKNKFLSDFPQWCLQLLFPLTYFYWYTAILICTYLFSLILTYSVLDASIFTCIHLFFLVFIYFYQYASIFIGINFKQLYNKATWNNLTLTLITIAT